MRGMFYDARCFNQPLDTWNVSEVTNMSHMFECAVEFNQPLNSWNVSKVTGMVRMFAGAYNFQQQRLDQWKTHPDCDMFEIFSNGSVRTKWWPGCN